MKDRLSRLITGLIFGFVLGAGLMQFLSVQESSQPEVTITPIDETADNIQVPSNEIGNRETIQVGEKTKISDAEGLLQLVSPLGYGMNLDLYRTLDQLGTEEFASIATGLEKVLVSDRRLNLGRRALFSRWAEVDPDAAWASAVNSTNIDQRSSGVHVVIFQIASRSVQAAEQLVEGLASDEMRESVIGQLITTVPMDDPAALLALLRRHSNHKRASPMYFELFQTPGFPTDDQPEHRFV